MASTGNHRRAWPPERPSDDAHADSPPGASLPQSQAALVDFLGRTLGTDGSCHRIDTHAASIFLAGDRAWKLKRAVRFPYLDFTTPDRRRAALDAELRLNRRTAPDLYLAVHPITRVAGGFAIDGPGEPVDWLLEMRRFPDGATLDDIAQRQLLDASLMIRLADRIHAFHRQARPAARESAAADIGRVIEGNAESLARYAALFGEDRVAALLDAQRRACARHTAILNLRGRKGNVRHCHGDLHLGNMALIAGEPVLFDCLEFDEELATTDTMYDLAFLLMDCWHRNLRAEANLVFNRYVDLSADEDGVRLLPLFLSLRATVRAHVIAATAERSGERSDTEEAERFFALAERTMEPGEAALLAIGGLSGTGKSAVARAIGGDFGSAPGARILRSDVLRKRLAGVQPEERLSQAFYSALANRVVYELLDVYAREHLDRRRFVIVDAVFAGADERHQAARTAAHAHVPFVGCWLEASETSRLSRVEQRSADASDADPAVVKLQSSKHIPSPSDWHRIAADAPLATVVASVKTDVKRLLEKGGSPTGHYPAFFPS